MSEPMSPLPELISDETAFALSEVLHWLALTCDEKYFVQIRRHMATMNDVDPIDSESPWMRK